MKKYIFVADAFENQYSGGAEITTEAIIEPVNDISIRINSHLLHEEFIKQNQDKVWVFCNFANLDDSLKILACKKLKYSIVEYDYKFCEYRSIEKHYFATRTQCNCTQTTAGKINLAFYGYAEKIWFMSEKQRDIFLQHVPTLKVERTSVLSSIFKKGDLCFMDNIRGNSKNNKYVILDSKSWIKGTQSCILYAKQNNLDYELVKNLSYHEMLIKLSCSKGLIFRPLGGDTCPRIVIEAKLLGCDLKLNENVQHKDEQWFTEGYEECRRYLDTRVDTFWRSYE